MKCLLRARGLAGALAHRLASVVLAEEPGGMWGDHVCGTLASSVSAGRPAGAY